MDAPDTASAAAQAYNTVRFKADLPAMPSPEDCPPGDDKVSPVLLTGAGAGEPSPPDGHSVYRLPSGTGAPRPHRNC